MRFYRLYNDGIAIESKQKNRNPKPDFVFGEIAVYTAFKDEKRIIDMLWESGIEIEAHNKPKQLALWENQ